LTFDVTPAGRRREAFAYIAADPGVAAQYRARAVSRASLASEAFGVTIAIVTQD
jgi:hypothetical protein